MNGLWRALLVAAWLAISTASHGNLPVAGRLDVPQGKSRTLSAASESGIQACEAAFDSPPDGQIVFRSLTSGSWFPPSGVAICKLDRGGYRVLSMSEPAKAGSRNSKPIETPLALRILSLFHSELERPRDRKSSELFLDLDTIVWIESYPELPKQTGETFDCVDRDTRLGRLVELTAALCWFRDCPADEQVRRTNQLDQIVTELEVALKFENRPGQ